MANIFRFIGKAAVAIVGIKLLDEILSRKRKEYHCKDKERTVDRTNAAIIPDQMIVWKKAGVSDAAYNQWKTDHLNRYPGLIVKKLCAHCDDSLELWEGDNVSTFISEGVLGSGGSPGGGGPSGGGDAIAFFSYNLVIDLPEQTACIPESKREVPLKPRKEYADPPITVAVFDTGLLPVIKGIYTGNVASCMPGGNLGWNFAYKNNITDEDNFPTEHGSAVTKFIIDQEDKYQQRKINILPVKIHNSNGKSDLFSVLCGFAYAANCGARIINASFGFYAAKSSKAPGILAEFVKKHLTNNNILLVAAAGNVNINESIGSNTTQNIRDLEQHPFFPACLSKDFENVITVTTISQTDGKVSPSQNFSSKMVDIGVNCDQQVNGDYRFEDPLGRGLLIVGSSYATPIVTGKIAQHYKGLMSGMQSSINKSILLKEMKNLGLVKTDPQFTTLIRDGNCSSK